MSYSRSEKDVLENALLSILAAGLLRIRVCGWGGHADQCALEADHLHNLPELIRTLDPKFLRYYYEISRQAFMERAKNTQVFDSHWSQIENVLKRTERLK